MIGQALAALNHANMSAVYGLDEHEDMRFVAMELVEGETPAKRLENGAQPPEPDRVRRAKAPRAKAVTALRVVLIS
jgi:hypothetical protein